MKHTVKYFSIVLIVCFPNIVLITCDLKEFRALAGGLEARMPKGAERAVDENKGLAIKYQISQFQKSEHVVF